MDRSGLLIRLLIGVLLAAGAAWFVLNTEWVDVDAPAALKGEAARKPHYAAARIVQGLGGTVVEPMGLERLPPREATLVLASSHWTVFPERAQALRAWVEGGGRLVVAPLLLGDEGLGWIPITSAKPRQAADPAADKPCKPRQEPDDVPATFEGRREFLVCGHLFANYRSSADVRWALDGPTGRHALRVPVGAGSVTVLDLWNLLHWRQVQRGDNALVFAAALRLGPGSEVWFVGDEARAPLHAWLWQHAAAALVLGALALAAWLWRGFVRFGPPAAPPPPGRRSVAEQVRGTAEFVWHRSPHALLAAARRALDEAAAPRVPGWRTLDAPARAQAAARAARLDARVLARALDPATVIPPKDAADALGLLETARRRIAARSTAPSHR